MTFRLGLTGGIGMGKSTTAAMFAEAGIPVWDADAAVHRLYGVGGAAVAPVSATFPDALVQGAIDRDRLKATIAADDTALPRLEAIVHPLVAADRARFIAETQSDMVLLDVPLLFETGGAADFDAVVIVSVPPDIQQERVLARPGMTREMFETIRARQMPDAEKRERADYVIETRTMDGARAAVQDVIAEIRTRIREGQ